MHPAASIIIFTTLSGLGYGLAAILGLGMLDPTALATKIAHILALALISGGLMSSTLHLGNPQRAWRAVSQWRSSWLSREGVMAILTFVPLLWSAWLCVFESRYVALAGLTGTVFSLGTIFCTAMIYASLKSVQTWHTPMTPLCYLLIAIAGGFSFASLVGFAGGGNTLVLSLLAVLFLIGAWSAKVFWRRNMQQSTPISTVESATGLGAIGRVRLLERPHMTENYLTKEMGFKVARKHAGKLWQLSILLGCVIPIVLLLVLLVSDQGGGAAAMIALLALLSHIVGVLCERWLFFAEARHAVMNYYGG